MVDSGPTTPLVGLTEKGGGLSGVTSCGPVMGVMVNSARTGAPLQTIRLAMFTVSGSTLPKFTCELAFGATIRCGTLPTPEIWMGYFLSCAYLAIGALFGSPVVPSQQCVASHSARPSNTATSVGLKAIVITVSSPTASIPESGVSVNGAFTCQWNFRGRLPVLYICNGRDVGSKIGHSPKSTYCGHVIEMSLTSAFSITEKLPDLVCTSILSIIGSYTKGWKLMGMDLVMPGLNLNNSGYGMSKTLLTGSLNFKR
mmetsp:Transcript_39066/g.87681  ORF Transcript_39066/g.87681 Transcript_39066/m.87681 type:complete len:256 (+) Transcript_39066:4563-5330(+)